MSTQLYAAGAAAGISWTILEIGAVFVGLGFLAWLAVKLRISSVPLFLVAGLALGKGGIAPLNLSEGFLNIGAEIGALLLLLVLGFEYSASELVQSLRNRWFAGVLDILLNALPAAVVALFLGFGWLGAIAFGGIMFVSSSGIASQLIRETGWSKSLVSSRATGILVVEDLLLAPYLPIVSASALGLSIWAGMGSLAVALAVTAVVFALARGRQVPGLRNLARSGSGALLLLVFGSALLVAGMANLSGFSGAIAAFLVGLLLTGEVAESLRHRFAPLREIFSAIFFLFFGLGIDYRSVIAVLPLALLFSTLGIVGKFALGWWVGRDLTDRQSWKRIGAFLSARGEFSMIIAATVVSDAALASVKEITLGMVVVTATVSTIAMRVLRSRLE